MRSLLLGPDSARIIAQNLDDTRLAHIIPLKNWNCQVDNSGITGIFVSRDTRSFNVSLLSSFRSGSTSNWATSFLPIVSLCQDFFSTSLGGFLNLRKILVHQYIYIFLSNFSHGIYVGISWNASKISDQPCINIERTYVTLEYRVYQGDKN